MSAAARHGLGVTYAGRLGAGPFFGAGREGPGARAHHHTPSIRNEQLDTGICVCLVEPDGERSFVTSPGPKPTLRAEDLATLDVGHGDFVLSVGLQPHARAARGTWVLKWLAAPLRRGRNRGV